MTDAPFPLWPDDAAQHLALAGRCRLRGDELAALAHQIAAQTLEAFAAQTPEASAQPLCDVATGYFMKAEFETSAAWYELALRLDPKLAVAYQNLAAIHEAAGRAMEAEACRDRAYRLQRVFVDQIGQPRRRVLVLLSGRHSGNIPYTTLLPVETCGRVKYAFDYADAAEDDQLPPYDLVFNAIGEPDVAGPLAARLERFAARCAKPLLNPPDVIARTPRHLLAERVADLADVVTAPCLRFERALATRGALQAALAGMAFPILARPAASHGGDGLTLCHSIEALEQAIASFDGLHYLTQFRDYRNADGLFRKYRMIFVDRRPLPYHLAISPQWMVHYFSADMVENPWKLAEERRFLEDPRAALGERALAAIQALGRRLDLDYGGVDFTVLPDGRVFVFEANATMLVHRERADGILAHKNIYVQNIADAFERLMVKKVCA